MTAARLLSSTAIRLFRQVLLLCAWHLAPLTEGGGDYMARLDPSLRTWTTAIRIGSEQLLYLQLHKGQLSAFAEPGGPEVELPDEQRQQLFAAFPADALAPEALAEPLTPKAWSQKLQQHAFAKRIDSNCPVNGENHLERTILDVFRALPGDPLGSVLTLGGLYGGRNGEGADAPDDPAVELLLEMQQSGVRNLQALCWGCDRDHVFSITRAQPVLAVMDVLPLPADALQMHMPILEPPSNFRGEVDLLRLDAMGNAGRSCHVLRALLKGGVRPRLLAMFVLSQVPPPFKFLPLGLDEAKHPHALLACSLSAVSEIVAPYGLSLLRLTGPYALFARLEDWPKDLPLNDLECYRGASVWGMDDIPLASVREWLFAPTEEALPRLWGNLTALYAAAAASAGTTDPDAAPFTLAL